MKKLNRGAHILLSILGSLGIVALPIGDGSFAHSGHSMLSIAQAEVPIDTGGDSLPLNISIGGSCCGAGADGNGCDGCCCSSE